MMTHQNPQAITDQTHDDTGFLISYDINTFTAVSLLKIIGGQPNDNYPIK
ncbi:MAG: hypothetical protein FWG88_11920 [Oscillospiraceae bacterium]|nr:hypothetical protein [Oscillospiraceae bacterium]